jgi:osmotically-inducible protein OsmY
MQFQSRVVQYGRSFITTAALSGCLLLAVPSFAQDQAPSADNSAQNKQHAMTADQQSSAKTDRALTAQIRKAIMADKSLSTYAHNVKIIAKGGSVTLKGPVKSDDEKQQIASKAAEVAGGPDKIDNQLTVKPQS